MAMHSNPFTVDVPDDISSAFTEICERLELTKWKAIAGALKAYLSLEEDAQLYLHRTSTTIEDAKKLISQSFIQAERKRVLGKLSPEQEAYLIEITKKTTKRLAQIK